MSATVLESTTVLDYDGDSAGVVVPVQVMCNSLGDLRGCPGQRLDYRASPSWAGWCRSRWPKSRVVVGSTARRCSQSS